MLLVDGPSPAKPPASDRPASDPASTSPGAVAAPAATAMPRRAATPLGVASWRRGPQSPPSHRAGAAQCNVRTNGPRGQPRQRWLSDRGSQATGPSEVAAGTSAHVVGRSSLMSPMRAVEHAVLHDEQIQVCLAAGITASSGVHTTGSSATLNDVFTSTGHPVSRFHSVSSAWNSGCMSGSTVWT